MRQLMMDDGPFDLIWSEGALFVMGFREGLETCHGLVASGGGLAVSELAWLSSNPPAECCQYFASAYPSLVDIDTNLETIRDCGYEIVGYLTLPESAWWEPCYYPLQARLESFRKKYSENREMMEMIESFQTEIGMYRRYSSHYGNVFYLAQRR